MLTKDVETMAGAAQGKADICEHYPVKFFIRAIMAGFFIVVATILSNISAAVLYSTYPQFGKLLGAFLFSIAIVLIVFIGGELFTGNNMTMAMGAYAGTCTWKQVLKGVAGQLHRQFCGCVFFKLFICEKRCIPSDFSRLLQQLFSGKAFSTADAAVFTRCPV